MAKNSKYILAILLSVMLLTTVYFGITRLHWLEHSTKITLAGTWYETPMPMPAFNYTSDTDQPFTQANLKGHWTLMFFGYANCLHVCPTTLSTLNQVYQQLQSRLSPDKLPQVVMVSVDPTRDSVAKMHAFVTAFNSHFIGIRAALSQTPALEQPLHIYAIKHPAKDGNPAHYMIEHSSQLFIIDPQGQLRGYFAFPEQVNEVVRDYTKIVNDKT